MVDYIKIFTLTPYNIITLSTIERGITCEILLNTSLPAKLLKSVFEIASIKIRA